MKEDGQVSLLMSHQKTIPWVKLFFDNFPAAALSIDDKDSIPDIAISIDCLIA